MCQRQRMIPSSTSMLRTAPPRGSLVRRISFPLRESSASHPSFFDSKSTPSFRRRPSYDSCSETRIRNNVARCAEQIAQRSSSKEVKSTLDMLEELCELKIQQSNKNSLPPPYAELEMLECLASDAYYRVIMIKYHGLATIDKASQAFPALAESCQHMLQLLQKAELAPAEVSSPNF